MEKDKKTEGKNNKFMTRRSFLAASGAVIAAGALSACTPKTTTETVVSTVTNTKTVTNTTTQTAQAQTTTVTGTPITVTGTPVTTTATKTATTTVTGAPVTTTATTTGPTVIIKPWIPTKWDYETDVVVAGTGFAGLAAAIAVVDAKSNLILLEKAPEQYAGGNSSVSVGGNSIWTVREEMLFDLRHAFNDVPDEDIVAFADNLAKVPDQLKKIGIELTANVTNTKPTWKIKTEAAPNGGPGSALWAAIKTAADGKGIKPMYETPATNLIQDPTTKEILGVVAKQAGKTIMIKARKGVILAVGGYENNPKMWSWYNHPGIEVAPGGTPYNTGDGINMVSEVGAPIWHCRLFEWEAATCAAASREMGCSVELSLPSGRMFVNRAGNRFVKETDSFTHVHEEIAPTKFERGIDVRPGLWYGQGGYPNMPFFLICDETYRKSGLFFPAARPGSDTKWCPVKKDVQWSADNSEEIKKGWIIQANTLDELATKLKIDAAGLKATVDKWNEYCANGVDPEFGVAKNSLKPIVDAPFYGMEMGLSLINTMGGPQKNGKSQTLDYAGKPIPR
jgi:hypothetical protein